jgi:hypothetical protein
MPIHREWVLGESIGVPQGDIVAAFNAAERIPATSLPQIIKCSGGFIIHNRPIRALQTAQALQGSLSGLVLNSLGQIGETLQARFNLMDGLFVSRKRLFD